MYNISKYEQFNHTNRAFDTNIKVDDGTYNAISDLIDNFLMDYPNANKIMITDMNIIKELFNLATTTDLAVSQNGDLRQTQIYAPLVITISPNTLDKIYLYKIGKLYSEIALTAIEREYYTGFCNCFNYEDPRFRRVENVLKMPFDKIDHNNYIIRSFISIGKRLDYSKPLNWHPWNFKIINSRPKLTDSFVHLPSWLHQQSEIP
jgi:hypothetical protein